MKIVISYDSIWSNSFLDNDNNSKHKTSRKYISSGAGLKYKKNFIKRNITIDTVMGLLNRLIGDQRKLYQSRKDEQYYFRDIDNTPSIMFKNSIDTISNDIVFLRNNNGSYSQTVFGGEILEDNDILNFPQADKLWGVLGKNLDELEDFILHGIDDDTPVDISNPYNIHMLMSEIKSIKTKKDFTEVIKYLNTKYPDKTYSVQNLVRIYSSALYLQVDRLKNMGYDIPLTPNGNILGIYNADNYILRDWIKNKCTKGQIPVKGNPYLTKSGEALTKVSGDLTIELDVTKERSNEIKEMIENAGVTSFHLGKKGLAYVKKIL